VRFVDRLPARHDVPARGSAFLRGSLEVATLGEQRVCHGAVVDEALLFGLLARFRMLGLLVTEMRQAPSLMG
jgi:hypothetical protein